MQWSSRCRETNERPFRELPFQIICEIIKMTVPIFKSAGAWALWKVWDGDSLFGSFRWEDGSLQPVVSVAAKGRSMCVTWNEIQSLGFLVGTAIEQNSIVAPGIPSLLVLVDGSLYQPARVCSKMGCSPCEPQSCICAVAVGRESEQCRGQEEMELQVKECSLTRNTRGCHICSQRTIPPFHVLGIDHIHLGFAALVW